MRPETTPCPSCGAEVNRGARFCAACGAVLVGACPSCGTESRIGAQFCSSCGHRLDRAAPKEEERKLVTVLFADLTGSTTLGEQLDPERLRLLLGEYFKAMGAVIESWGGTVEKFIGDAVMAVFGIPTMHEDDAERAVQAALDMQARLDEMNPELAERHGVRLSMRVGVNTGDVIAGTGGDELMVTGDVVNVAARLQQAAEPGQIVAGDRTYLASRDAYVFHPMGEKTLKGKAAPVRAWRVVERAEIVHARGVPGLWARMVGRDRELSLLETLYRAAVEESRPRLVTILGHAGIGKTRLTEEFLRVAESDEVSGAVYRGRCLPYGRGITYWALREMLWGAAGILLDDPATEAAEKLRKLVREAFAGSRAEPSEIDRVAFALAVTAGIAIPENPLEEMAPESVGEEVGLAWPQFLSALATDRPAVLVIEDLHFAEAPLPDMLERLVSRTAGPVLILATARPEFAETRPAWSGRPGMSQIGLEPLTEAQSEDLLEELLPRVGAEVRKKILSAAEGNPFFAEEIVRHLIDEGVLRRDDGELVEGAPVAVLDIPDTVRALIAARVDALHPDEKRTLQDAAVVGRIFWATTLESMEGHPPVRRDLQALEDRGLVVTRPGSALPGQSELAFIHGLTREVAYQSIPKGRRAKAHAEVGRWIEDVADQRRDEFIELIAHHYEAAAQPEDADLAWPGDPEAREEVQSKAISALLDAGRAARIKFAIDHAVGFADRALALAVTDAERLAALELKASAAHAGVRVEEGWGFYVEALELASKLHHAETVSRLRAHATLLWARYGGAFTGEDWRAQAVDIFTQGLQETGENSTTFETGALLLGRSEFDWWFSLQRSRSLEENRRDIERVIEIAEAVDSASLRSYALDALSSVVRGEGFCESAAIGERMVRVSHGMADRVEAHELLVEAARSLAEAGQFDAARQVADEAVRQGAQLSSHHQIHAARAQAMCLHPMGLLEDLLEATSGVAQLVLEEGGHPCGMGVKALTACALAMFEVRTDRTTVALQLLDAATPSLRGMEWYEIAESLRPLLSPEETRAKFEQGLAAEETVGDVATKIKRYRVELPLRALSQQWDRLEEAAAEARTLSGPACAPYLDWMADWAEAVRMTTEGRPQDALAKATAALSELDAYGERYTAARLMVDLLPFLDPDGARETAAELVPRLEAMGAAASAAEARRFL